MPKFTTTLEVELEITFDYSWQPAEPDVGITNAGPESVTIDSIKHIRPTIQMQKPTQLDNFRATDEKILLQPWLQFDASFEEEIIARIVDQLEGPDEERSYYDR